MGSKRDLYQSELVAMLGRYGVGVRSDPTLPPNQRGDWQRDRADSVCGRGGRLAFIEFKTAHGGRLELFSEHGWRTGQREWAQKVRESRMAEVWLATVFAPVKRQDGYSRIDKDAFLTPYPVSALAVQWATDHKRLSINYKGACDIWGMYRLEWKPGEGWSIPEQHLFSVMYLRVDPLPLSDDLLREIA